MTYFRARNVEYEAGKNAGKQVVNCEAVFGFRFQSKLVSDGLGFSEVYGCKITINENGVETDGMK